MAAAVEPSLAPHLVVDDAAAAIDFYVSAFGAVELGRVPSPDGRLVHAAIQINGARGYSKDTPLEWIYRYARQARLVDGADEVHQMVLNRLQSDDPNGFWTWPVSAA